MQVFEYSEESKEQLEEAAAGDKGILQSILEVIGCSDKRQQLKEAAVTIGLPVRIDSRALRDM